MTVEKKDPYKRLETANKNDRLVRDARNAKGVLKVFYLLRIAAYEFGLTNTRLLEDCWPKEDKFQGTYLTNGRGRPHSFGKFKVNIISYLQELASNDPSKSEWNISYQVLFNTNYQDPKQFKLALQGKGYPLQLRLTRGKKRAEEYTALNIEQELTRLKKLLENRDHPLIILKGECGSGKSTLLEHGYRYLSEHSESDSVVKIDVSRYNSIESIFDDFRIQLEDKLRNEIKPGSQVTSSHFGNIANSVAKLMQYRKSWVLFLDTDASYQTSRDSRFSELVRGINVVHILRNLMSISGLVNSDVRIVMTTQDFNFSLPRARELTCNAQINYEVFKGTHFADRIDDVLGLTASTRPVYQLLLFNRLLNEPWMAGLEAERRTSLLEEVLNSVKTNTFDRLLHEELIKLLEHNNYYCLLICCLPDDDIRQASLEDILVDYIYRPGKNLQDFKKKAHSEVKKFRRNFEGELFESFVKEECNEEVTYFRVHPYIRKLILDECDQPTLRLYYKHTGKFAYKKFSAPSEEAPKVSSSVALESNLSTSYLSEKHRNLAQAVRFLIRSREAEYKPQKVWKKLKKLLNELVLIDGMEAIELRYSLLVEFIFSESEARHMSMYQNPPPIITKRLLRLLNADVRFILNELLTITQQLGMHGSTLSVCEQVNAGLIEFDKNAESHGDNLMQKTEEAYFYVANRTGRYHEAMSYLERLHVSREARFTAHLSSLHDEKYDFKLKMYQSKYLDTLTKQLMVQISLGDLPQALQQVNKINREIEAKNRIKCIDRRALLNHIRKSNPLVSSKMLKSLYVANIETLLSPYLDENTLKSRSEMEKEAVIVGMNGKLEISEAHSKCLLNIGNAVPTDILVPQVEVIRFLLRFQSLCRNSESQSEVSNTLTDQTLNHFDKTLEHFRQSFVNKFPLRSVSNHPNAFNALYILLGHVSLFIAQIRNTDQITNSQLRKYEYFRRQLLLLDWHRSLSVPWQNDVITELVRLELTMTFVESNKAKESRKSYLAISPERYRWIHNYIQRLWEESESRQDVRTLSTAITLKALWGQLVDLNDVKVEGIVLTTESPAKQLQELSAKFQYKYRDPEIKFLSKGIPLLRDILV